MAEHVARQWYENVPGYKGIEDNLILDDDDLHVQRWKWEQQQEWVKANTPSQSESSSAVYTEQPFTVSLTTNVGSVLGLDNLHSGNGSNLIPLKRMEIIYKDLDVKFAVNPSDYTQKEPNRVNLTQTKGGAWIDSWGAGIVEFNIKGITGVFGQKFHASKDNYFSKLVNTGYDVARVLSGDNGVDVGYQRWKELRDLFREVYKAVEDGEAINDYIQFYNFTDNEYWYCYPSPAGIELYRSKSKPHVYQYTLNLWGLRRIGDPQITLTMGVIGNPNKNQSTTANNVGYDTSSSEFRKETNYGNDAEGEKFFDAAGESTEFFNIGVDSQGLHTTARTSSSAKGSPTSYTTGTTPLNTEVDVITTTTTTSKGTETLREQSKQYADRLAPIIGGSGNGKLVPTTAYEVARDLALTNLGAVLHVSGFNQSNLLRDTITKSLPTNRLTQEIDFEPVVSPETYYTWRDIRDYSPDILADDLITPGTLSAEERIIKTIKTVKYYGSSLYEYILQYKQKYYITKTEIKYLKMVMMETMNLYVHLYKIYFSTGQIDSPLALSNIKTLIQNVQSLILYLEFNSTDSNTFYIQNLKFELRQIEVVLHQVKTDIIEYL